MRKINLILFFLAIFISTNSHTIFYQIDGIERLRSSIFTVPEEYIGKTVGEFKDYLSHVGLVTPNTATPIPTPASQIHIITLQDLDDKIVDVVLENDHIIQKADERLHVEISTEPLEKIHEKHETEHEIKHKLDILEELLKFLKMRMDATRKTREKCIREIEKIRTNTINPNEELYIKHSEKLKRIDSIPHEIHETESSIAALRAKLNNIYGTPRAVRGHAAESFAPAPEKKFSQVEDPRGTLVRDTTPEPQLSTISKPRTKRKSRGAKVARAREVAGRIAELAEILAADLMAEDNELVALIEEAPDHVQNRMRDFLLNRNKFKTKNKSRVARRMMEASKEQLLATL
ncbi:hypothetical protein HN446_05255 [bacterium]|jgi:hypothetical protein|nr:hypothetical protein [bacterium]